ncbi:PLP-dependent aminotransferase family protein, partial [bacterium]|nr:PLP-dependent aminotransferase family protein [bacterium]
MGKSDKFVSIHLDRDSKEPLYLQLYKGIVSLIENGVLEVNQKLPPIRKLAKSLNINTVTVVNAYKLLEKEGYIRTKVGSGSYVTPIKKASQEESVPENKVVRYNFASASIPPSLFPIDEFKEAIIKVLDSEGGYAFECQETAGYRPLRETINKVLLVPQDIKVDTDNIYIVSGAQQGIEIVAKLLLDYQDVVYVERPTYPGAISAFKSRSAKIVEIPLREDGLDINELEYMLKIKPPKLLYIIPNFQNPTGYSYSEQKKRILLELAERYDFMILEDDHLNELYYQERAKPLKAFDINDRVFYIKSFSKLFMPGLRLGFIVSPEVYGRKVLEIKYLSDISSSSLTQKTLNILLKDDSFKKHIEKVRNIFYKRWEIVVKSLE